MMEELGPGPDARTGCWRVSDFLMQDCAPLSVQPVGRASTNGRISTSFAVILVLVTLPSAGKGCVPSSPCSF